MYDNEAETLATFKKVPDRQQKQKGLFTPSKEEGEQRRNAIKTGGAISSSIFQTKD
jgi:hypothetical protein